MNKKELISCIAKDTKITKKKSVETLNIIIKNFYLALKKNNIVNLIGFGSFKIKTRKAYESKNPKTGKKMYIKKRKIIIFKMGKVLKKIINL